MVHNFCTVHLHCSSCTLGSFQNFAFSMVVLQSELQYVLYAVVVHVGLTPTSGHYYCFIRLSPDMWCKFDDSKVMCSQFYSVRCLCFL